MGWTCCLHKTVNFLNGQEVSTEVEGIRLDNIKVSLKEDTVILANSQLLVSAKVNVTSLKHTTALMEPIPGKTMEEGLLIAKCLVDLARADTCLPVHVINVTAKSVLLHKDTVIGQLSELESIKVLFESENSPSHSIPGKKIDRVCKAAISKHTGGQGFEGCTRPCH